MSSSSVRIAVCDNEAQDLQQLAELTRHIVQSEDIDYELACYESSKALLEAVESGEAYHILLLDVMMEGLSGIELAAALRALQSDAEIVFVSSNREMAMYGYEVAAVRYLAKPVQEEKLREALLYCCRSRTQRKEIALSTARGVRRIQTSDIIYVETWGRGVRVTLTDGQEEVGLKISQMEAMLPAEQFFLCHRTVLVNLAYVQYIRYCELELKTGAVLPVSKYRQNDARERLLHYLMG